MTITLDDLNRSRMHHTTHLDGPRGRDGWFGDMHACTEYPRLQRRVRYWRHDRSHDVTWFVDGAEVGPDLAAVVPLLNIPPVLTADEQAALEHVGTEFADLRRQDGVSLEALLMLRAKGVIEFHAGACRRRP